MNVILVHTFDYVLHHDAVTSQISNSDKLELVINYKWLLQVGDLFKQIFTAEKSKISQEQNKHSIIGHLKWTMRQHLSLFISSFLSTPFSNRSAIQNVKCHANITANAIVLASLQIANWLNQVSAINQYNCTVKLHCILGLLKWHWKLLVNAGWEKKLLLLCL